MRTQLPYAILVALCSGIGYLVAGLVTPNPWVCLGVSAALLVSALVVLNRISSAKEAKAA